MENVIIIALIGVIICAAARYVYKSKKSGKKCIGCPDGGCGGKECCRCNNEKK